LWYHPIRCASIGNAMTETDKQEHFFPLSRPPRFQFSLGRLMIVVTIACVMLGVWEILPVGFVDNVVISSIVLGVIPTVLITCSIYARGDLQTFAMGALVPWLSVLITQGGPLRVWGLGAWFFVGGVCGVVAVATRRWLESRDST
jgi:hypothetical protein